MTKRESTAAEAVCQECGQHNVFTRKASKRKKRGHVKHMWCISCEEVTAHTEVND